MENHDARYLAVLENHQANSMTRRHYAIEQAVIEIIGHNRPPASTVAALNRLIDQAEAGKLKEPVVRHFAGINGVLTVYPDGRGERS